MARNWLMEPDPSIGSYDEVPWYRRTWFVTTMIFVFWPAAFIIAATGDVFQRANGRARRHSEAEVWRSTGTGRVVMAGCGLVLTAIYGPRLLALVGDLTEEDRRPSRPAAAELEPDPESEPPADVEASAADDRPLDDRPLDEAPVGEGTAVEQEPAPPSPGSDVPRLDPEFEAIDRRLAEVLREADAIASAVLGGDDLTPALVAAFGDDRYADVPLVGDARIDRFTLAREDEGDGRPSSVISVWSSSGLDVDAAVEAVATIASDRGHVEDGREDETDADGIRTVSIDFEPLASSSLLFEGLGFDVSSTETGVEIRTFRFLVDDQPLAPSSLLTRALPAFPLPDGYEPIGAEITFSSRSSSPALALRILAPEPDMMEQEVFDAIVEAAGPVWAFDRAGSNFIRLRSEPREATVGVSPLASKTIVRIRIS